MKKPQLGKRDDFLEGGAYRHHLIKDLIPRRRAWEGYLFPDTYHFTRTQSLHDMAAAMDAALPPGSEGPWAKPDFMPWDDGQHRWKKRRARRKNGRKSPACFITGCQKAHVLATDPSVIYACAIEQTATTA